MICGIHSECPIVDMKVTDNPEAFEGWEKIEFENKTLVYTKTEEDKSPIVLTYVGPYPCLYPDLTTKPKEYWYELEFEGLQDQCQKQDERYIKLDNIKTNELKV